MDLIEWIMDKIEVVKRYFHVKMCEPCQVIPQRVLNQKVIYCSFEKLSRSATKIVP